MGRREALLEQQPHRVALVAEGGLDADEDVAELPRPARRRRARRTGAAPAPGPRAPRSRASHGVVAHDPVGGHMRGDVGLLPVSAARCLRAPRSRSSSTVSGGVEVVALGLHPVQRVAAGSRRPTDRPPCRPRPHSAGSRRARWPRCALGHLRAPQPCQPQSLVGQRLDPLGAGRHGPARIRGTPARSRQPSAPWRPAKTVGLVAPSISGSATSIVVSTGPRPRPRSLPTGRASGTPADARRCRARRAASSTPTAAALSL